LIAEVAILLLLDLVILGDGGDSGLTLAGFEPSEVFGGAAGVAIMFAFSCFVGFEATTIYGEEARDPQRTVPRATYVAIVAIGLFYTLTMWSIGVGYGSGNVAGAAQEDPVGFVFALTSRYVGDTATDAMNFLVLTSLLAVVLAFHNTLARYLFSLGRAGVLPGGLGRTREQDGAPHVASVAQTCVTLLIVGGFMVFDADPLLNLFAWLVGLGTLGVLALQATASIAVIAFFRRTGKDTRPWQTLIAPALGFAGLVTAIYLVLRNFDVLTGATSGAVPLLPWLIPLAALLGVAVWAARPGAAVDIGRTAGDSDRPGGETAVAPSAARP
jgi:amino acid transporter